MIIGSIVIIIIVLVVVAFSHKTQIGTLKNMTRKFSSIHRLLIVKN